MSIFDGQETRSTIGTARRPDFDAGPLGPLPTLSRRQVRLDRRIGEGGPEPGPVALLAGIADLVVEGATADRFEVVWRASGLARPGVIAQLAWPRLATRVGLGIEPALAHAIVDRLLGFDRLPGEGRLQVTPVEWGVLSFALARALDRLDRQPGPLGPWDLAIDRVGPDPFDPSGLGPLVTWRWRVRIGHGSGWARLWLPESLLENWLADEPPGPALMGVPTGRYRDLSSAWRAEAGRATMPRGLARLRPGSLVPIDGAPLRGTPASPSGPVELALTGPSGRWSIRARPAPDSAAARLILESPLAREPRPRERHVMAPDPAASATNPAEVPVTLIVELGRVDLPLGRLADLKPGDVLDLARHSREPVELTSGGRLVARGELVQIDTELGVRVTHVFL